MARVPAYPSKPHSSGQARVKWRGEVIYLGKFGSAESYEKLGELLSKIGAALQAKEESPALNPRRLTVHQLCDAYRMHCKIYYANTRDERVLIGYSHRPLIEVCGVMLARDFGPLSLQKVRDRMLTMGKRKLWSRRFINKQCGRIRRMFKWAVAQELVKPSVYAGLMALSPLVKGKTTARETEPVKPVDPALIKAVLPFCNRHVATMIQVQHLAGMRSCELVQLRGELVDMTTHDGLWEFTLVEHKNGWRGQTQIIYLGENSQRLLAPFVKADPAERWFSPVDARNERHAARSAAAKAPISEEKKKRRRAVHPRRKPGSSYTTRTYRRHIERALAKLRKQQGTQAKFHPHQIRHLVASEIRKSDGAEAARVALGHARLSSTEIYAERDLSIARRIARERG
jgi:integrase